MNHDMRKWIVWIFKWQDIQKNAASLQATRKPMIPGKPVQLKKHCHSRVIFFGDLRVGVLGPAGT